MKILGMGPLELLIILGVLIVLFGPKLLPKLGSGIGKAIGNLRAGVRDGERERKRYAGVADEQAEIVYEEEPEPECDSADTGVAANEDSTIEEAKP